MPTIFYSPNKTLYSGHQHSTDQSEAIIYHATSSAAPVASAEYFHFQGTHESYQPLLYFGSSTETKIPENILKGCATITIT